MNRAYWIGFLGVLTLGVAVEYPVVGGGIVAFSTGFVVFARLLN